MTDTHSPLCSTSSARDSVFGRWRRSPHCSETQRPWLNESIPKCSPSRPRLSCLQRRLLIDHMTIVTGGIQWVLMVRHTRMQQQLLSPFATSERWWESCTTQFRQLTLTIKKTSDLRVHLSNFRVWMHKLCLQLHLICLAVLLFLHLNKSIRKEGDCPCSLVLYRGWND